MRKALRMTDLARTAIRHSFPCNYSAAIGSAAIADP